MLNGSYQLFLKTLNIWVVRTDLVVVIVVVVVVVTAVYPSRHCTMASTNISKPWGAVWKYNIHSITSTSDKLYLLVDGLSIISTLAYNDGSGNLLMASSAKRINFLGVTVSAGSRVEFLNLKSSSWGWPITEK